MLIGTVFGAVNFIIALLLAPETKARNWYRISLSRDPKVAVLNRALAVPDAPWRHYIGHWEKPPPAWRTLSPFVSIRIYIFDIAASTFEHSPTRPTTLEFTAETDSLLEGGGCTGWYR
jgi:hypothetical protein